jgi:carboxynorspermidine decarboxylase
MTSSVSDNVRLAAAGPPSERSAGCDILETPCFVFDEAVLSAQIDRLTRLARTCGVKPLYSIKACPLGALLERIAPRVDGFSVSSLFEARLARQALGNRGTVHLTTPGLSAEDAAGLAGICDYLSFNSLSQQRRLAPLLDEGIAIGLRINPRLSLVGDERYDPCRRHSKLGVPLDDLVRWLGDDPDGARGLTGLHFHTHHDSPDLTPLAVTVEALMKALPQVFASIAWLNLGGGYRLEAETHGADRLAEVLDRLRRQWPVEVFVEPGKAVIDDVGTLIATVLDVFESDGAVVAILDTSVNHLPEAFEYQRPPVIAEATGGGYRCILAGGTCLAGDLFGEYEFPSPLAPGARLTFTGVGAYTLVKAHRFNGHNLPAVALRVADGGTRVIKRHDYADFSRQWSADR